MLRTVHHVQIAQPKFRRRNGPKFNGANEVKTIYTRHECGSLILEHNFCLQLFRPFTKTLIIVSL